MPRETVTPLHNHRLDTPEGGRYVPKPVVHVGWHKELGEVQIGLEYQDVADVPGSYAIVDALYGDVPTQTQIARLLVGRIMGSDADLLDRITSAENADQEADLMNELGRVILDCVTGSSVGGGYTSLWTDLDRAAINRLIRLARQARDAAFGRDE